MYEVENGLKNTLNIIKNKIDFQGQISSYECILYFSGIYKTGLLKNQWKAVTSVNRRKWE